MYSDLMPIIYRAQRSRQFYGERLIDISQESCAEEAIGCEIGEGRGALFSLPGWRRLRLRGRFESLPAAIELLASLFDVPPVIG